MIYLTKMDISVANTTAPCQIAFEVSARSNAHASIVGKLADSFVAAANFGMFSLNPKADSTAIEIELVEKTKRNVVKYLWNTKELQLGAYRVLLNLLEMENRHSGSIESVHLKTLSSNQERLHLDNLPSIRLRRGQEDAVPFLLTGFEDSKRVDEPIFRLTFDGHLTDSDVLALSPIFLAWDQMAIGGGFLDEASDFDSSSTIESQQTYLASPRTVEHALYEFAGNESAIASFVNLADRLHHVHLPLVSLEIA